MNGTVATLAGSAENLETSAEPVRIENGYWNRYNINASHAIRPAHTNKVII
jgi:hypothetical protein